jgi:hypothetical protein
MPHQKEEEILSLSGWNTFGHLRETAPHGKLNGGRVAFNATRTSFDDAGCPVLLRDMGHWLNWMGCNDDDETDASSGCSAEFYGTKQGNGAHRAALPALSGRALAGDPEDDMLTTIGLAPVAVLRRFLLSKQGSILSGDDQAYCWDVLRECEACECTEDVDERIESLFRDIKRNIGRKATVTEDEANELRVQLGTLCQHPMFNRLPEALRGWGFILVERFGGYATHAEWAADAQKHLKKVRGILAHLEHKARRQAAKAKGSKPKRSARKGKESKANGRKVNGRKPRFHSITLVQGKNSRTGEMQWEAKTGRGVMFILRRNCDFVPKKGECRRYREDGLIAKTRKGKIIAVVPA